MTSISKYSLLHTLALAVVLLAMAACSPGPGHVDPVEPNEGAFLGNSHDKLHVKPISASDMSQLLSDTVTPPNNPLAPNNLADYPTFQGSLGVAYVSGFADLSSGYYCCIHFAQSLDFELDGKPMVASKFFLLDYPSKLIRFDHSMLQDFCVGDQLLVTGVPCNIGDTYIGIYPYFIQKAQ